MNKLLPLIMIFLASCSAKSEIEKEIKTLLSMPGTATGSELVTQLCGWPSMSPLELKSLDIEMDPRSRRSDGSGTANITAAGKGYEVSGRLFFIFSTSYTGGHGYSGSSDLRIGPINRESPVGKSISAPQSAVEIAFGNIVSGEIKESSKKLPDGSFAEYYTLDVKGEKPAIKVTVKSKTKGFFPKGCIYQNSMMISGFDDYGSRVKPGRVYILVTDGPSRGEFTILVTELSEKEKEILR